MSISILLADDHPIFREGLQMLLGLQPDFQVVGQAEDGLQAVALAEKLRPDVVIVDMAMPGLNGIEVIRLLKHSLADCRLVVLSMHDDEYYVQSALKYGADGYVLKDTTTADLVQAIRSVMAGNFFLSPSLSRLVIQGYARQVQPPAGSLGSLTGRECQVLQLSVQGYSSVQIAGQLSISIRTVETHRQNFFHKLGLHSQADLIAYAYQNKILPLHT